MPRAANGVYTRVSNSFSEPVEGTVIDPDDANALFDDQDDTGFNNLPVQILSRSVTNPAYGATGDGSTNDTAAVQAALNALAGGICYFPAGTYSVTHIDLPANVHMIGDGIGKTTIKCRSAPSAGTDWIYSATPSGIEIEGITFDGNGNLTNLASGHQANVVPCVYLVGGSNVSVHDNAFIGWDTCGFETNTTDTVSVRNNIVTRSVGSPGYLVSPTGSGTDGAITSGTASFTSASASFQVADQGKIIRVVGAGVGGIPLVTTILTRNSATNVTLSINASATVSGATYQYGGNPVGNYGIFLAGTGTVDSDNLANFVVDGNIVTNSSIAISGHDGVVSNNIVSGHGFGAGIHTQGLASNFNVDIIGNTCFNGLHSQDTAGAYPGGIENWAPGGSVSNNSCYGNWGPGISVAAKAVYSGNICYNNGQSGVTGSAGISSFYQDATFNANGALIVGNKCYDNQTPKTQAYGYFENSNLIGVGADINLIGNDFGDNLTADTLLRSMTRSSNMASTVTINAGGFSGGTIDSAAITGVNPLTVLNVGPGAFNLQLRPNATMTGNRILNLAMDANRTLTLGGDISVTGNLTTSAGVTFSGPFVYSGGSTFTLSTSGVVTLTATSDTSIGRGQYLGTATNDSATAGNIGEFMSASLVSGSAVSLTNNTAITVTSISLTAGDWDVSGVTVYKFGASTTVNECDANISTTNNSFDGTVGTFSTQVYPSTFTPGSSVTPGVPTLAVRKSLSGTTTVYLIAFCTFATSTASAFGFIRARRVR